MKEFLEVIGEIFIDTWVHVIIAIPSIGVGFLFGYCTRLFPYNLTTIAAAHLLAGIAAFLLCEIGMRAFERWFSFWSALAALLACGTAIALSH